ncbi:MAG: endonuclease III domain-containing protein [Opitutales bacterium]
MRKDERARYIGEVLDQLYPETPIPLDHRDPFTLLVAVLLSAQTTDKKVNEVTPELFRVAGTPAELARLQPEAILAIIRPLGLAPQKAKHLAALGRLLMERHGGQVPRTLEELEALPGVGHKTASVVLVQAFGVPAFPVDTHIHRLAQCWQLTRGKNVVQTEADLKKCFPEDTWYRRHLQIIFYGRERCPARPREICAICRYCFPRRTKPRAVNKA